MQSFYLGNKTQIPTYRMRAAGLGNNLYENNYVEIVIKCKIHIESYFMPFMLFLDFVLLTYQL